jgi:hypothetical protein
MIFKFKEQLLWEKIKKKILTRNAFKKQTIETSQMKSEQSKVASKFNIYYP